VAVHSDGAKSSNSFCFKTNKAATRTFKTDKIGAYGDNALSRTRVYEWCTKLRDCRGNLEDERSEQYTAVRKTDMIETIRELISTDRRMVLRMIVEVLKISREIIRHLGKREGLR
jgi:hypothetical protein